MSDLSHFWWQAPAGGGGAIGNSLRFRGAQSLSRTTTALDDRKKFTWSLWTKKAAFDTADRLLIQAGPSGSDFSIGNHYEQRLTVYGRQVGTFLSDSETSALFRDPSAWQHIVVSVDTTRSSDRQRVFINGVLVTAFTKNTQPGINEAAFSPPDINVKHTIGSTTSGGGFFLGYMAEVHFTSGVAYDETAFGEFNTDGVWVPKKVSGLTYGANGYYLDFSDPANIGKDWSGNNNDFTATGFELTTTTSANYDWVADSPTKNFATINPLYPGASASNANLTTANATGKPTILPGTTKTVRVNGANQAWNGTEAGWTYTGDVDFGQRQATGDDVSTAELPAVAITKPSDHFTTILDTGANILTAAQAKFPSGLYSICGMDGDYQLRNVDTVRGATKMLRNAGNVVEETYSAPTASMAIAYCWATPGTPAANSSGTITSTVDANTVSGFSIVTYTGNGVTGATIGHGLGGAPDYIHVQKRSGAANAGILYLGASGPGHWQNFNTPFPEQASNMAWNGVNPTSSVFTVGNDVRVNGSGETYVAWCWRSIPGFSSIGKYTGNGNADNAFVYCGFTPKFLMTKSLTTGNGYWQHTGVGYNPTTEHIDISNHIKNNVGTVLDFVSNGFKIRSVNSIGDAGAPFMYVAFAEHPFGGSNVSPATAR